MNDLDQVGLIRHHFVEVLVGGGDFVQHTLVLAADDAFGLSCEIADGKPLLSLGPAHPAPGAMGAGVETVRRALAAHDIAARPHAARDDAEAARARADL